MTMIRGGEWSFKKSGSRKILAEFQGSRSLVFSADLRSRSLDFFRNVQKSQISRSGNLKSGKVSVSQRKTLVSPSRKVSILPFATPILYLFIYCLLSETITINKTIGVRLPRFYNINYISHRTKSLFF